MGKFIRRLVAARGATTHVTRAIAAPTSRRATGGVRRRALAPLCAIAGLSLVLAACSSGSSSSSTTSSGGSTGATGTPVKIALVTSLTGAASAQFQTAPAGFLAAVAAQNAKGGINGHKIVTEVLDDQSSPSQTALVIQKAISDGNIGIVADSSLFFLGAKYAQQAGIPVTGGSFDGPEWGTQPYTNMFASDVGSVDPTFPVNTFDGKVLKAQGGTNLGTFGYGISPQSAYATYGAAKSAELVGLKAPVVDASVPYGSESFGTEALSAKSGGIDSLVANMDNNSNFALLTAIKQEGVNLKAVFFPAGYDQSLIGSNVWQALQGSVFGTTFRPFQISHNAGITAMQSAADEVPGLEVDRLPDLRAVRVLHRGDAHDAGHRAGRHLADLGEGDLVAAPQGDGVERERDRRDHDQLRHELRDVRGEDLRVDPPGQVERLRASQLHAPLWCVRQGHDLEDPIGVIG